MADRQTNSERDSQAGAEALVLAVQVPGTKVCSKCGTPKVLAGFHRSKASRDGRVSACKECRCAEERKWNLKNPGYAAKRHREFRAANPHAAWASDYRDRCRDYGLVAVVVPFTKNALIERWGNFCAECGGLFEQIDHIRPVAAGGSHSLDNVRPICRACNEQKRAESDLALIREFRIWRAQRRDPGAENSGSQGA